MDTNIAVQRTLHQDQPPVGQAIGHFSDTTLVETSLQIQRDLAFALSSSNNLEDILCRILEAILLIKGVDCGGVYLVDLSNGGLHLANSTGLSPRFVASVVHFEPQAFQTLAVMKGEPIYVHFQEICPRHDSIRASEGLRALAIIPIKSEGNVIAVLALASHKYDTIQKQVRDMLDVIARQIGGVIARVRAENALRESQNNLQSLFDTLDDFLFIFSQNGRILHFNPVVEHRLGYSHNELHRMNITDIHIQDQRLNIKTLLASIDSAQTSVITIPLATKYGKQVAVETRISRGKWNNHDVLFSISRDITALKKTEEMLLHANEQLKFSVSYLEQRNLEITLMNEMGDHLQSCLSVDDAYPVIKQYMAKLFPNQSGALYMHNHQHNLVESVTQWGNIPEQTMIFAPDECWSLRRGRIHIVENVAEGLQCPHIKNTDLQATLCVPIIAQGDTMGVLHMCSQSHIPPQTCERWRQLAITIAEHIALALANLKLRECLHYQSTHDALTGLFNRRYLEETLERELHKAIRYHRQVGVIMLDIDHFKQFNDIYGHKAGDTMLHAVGAFLQNNIRGADIACRYGGEEFTLILPEVSLEDSIRRAQQIATQIRNLQVEFGGKILGQVTLSLGIASFPDHGETSESLIRAADNALYRAKAEGRDRAITAQTNGVLVV